MAVVLYSTFTRGRGREGSHGLCGMELCQAVLGAVAISWARHPVLSLIPCGRQGPIYRCAIGGSHLNVSKCISHFIWMYQHVSPIFLPRDPWLNVDHRWPCSRPGLTHVTNSKGVAPPHPPRVLSSDRQTAELSWPSQEGEPWGASQWPSVHLWLPLAHTRQNSRWPAISPASPVLKEGVWEAWCARTRYSGKEMVCELQCGTTTSVAWQTIFWGGFLPCLYHTHTNQDQADF